jgi:hypothetical protein
VEFLNKEPSSIQEKEDPPILEEELASIGLEKERGEGDSEVNFP